MVVVACNVDTVVTEVVAVDMLGLIQLQAEVRSPAARELSGLGVGTAALLMVRTAALRTKVLSVLDAVVVIVVNLHEVKLGLDGSLFTARYYSLHWGLGRHDFDRPTRHVRGRRSCRNHLSNNGNGKNRTAVCQGL